MPHIQNIFYAPSTRDTKLPVLVLIHGAGSSHLAWSGELRRLPNYRVLAIDLPAHGRSSGEGKNTIEAYAADVLAMLDALHISYAILAGHSMGGAIAQMLALQYPTRVKGLILIGTGAKLEVNEKIIAGLIEDQAATVAMINHWQWAKDAPEHLKQLAYQALMEVPATIIQHDYIACSQFDVTHRLGEMTMPTLVIGGSQDKMTPFKLSEDLAANIPHAELICIEGGGHYMMLEQPKMIAEAVQNWLRTLP